LTDSPVPKPQRVKRLGLHRVDGRSYWFAAYFNEFRRDLMIRYAGQARADRFDETFGGRIPFPHARIVGVYDADAEAARQFADTFDVPPAATVDDFAEGLDGVIVPFPAGGPARDYGVIEPLLQRGLPLFLDRIILEQSDRLRRLCDRATALSTPLLITCFLRYVDHLLLPDGAARPHSIVASTGGEPNGYGADLLDLVDQLMAADVASVVNVGDAHKDVLRIRYSDGRHAILQLFHEAKQPMHVTAMGDGWSRSLQINASHFHIGAMRQFEAFLRSLDTREPAVPYHRVLANAAVLHAAERREFGKEISCVP